MKSRSPYAASSAETDPATLTRTNLHSFGCNGENRARLNEGGGRKGDVACIRLYRNSTLQKWRAASDAIR